MFRSPAAALFVVFLLSIQTAHAELIRIFELPVLEDPVSATQSGDQNVAAGAGADTGPDRLPPRLGAFDFRLPWLDALDALDSQVVPAVAAFMDDVKAEMFGGLRGGDDVGVLRPRLEPRVATMLLECGGGPQQKKQQQVKGSMPFVPGGGQPDPAGRGSGRLSLLIFLLLCAGSAAAWAEVTGRLARGWPPHRVPPPKVPLMREQDFSKDRACMCHHGGGSWAGADG